MRQRLSIWLTRLAACVVGVCVWMTGGAAAEAQAVGQEPVVLTNSLDATSGNYGAILTSEVIGADVPGPDEVLAGLSGTDGLIRLGETNQWRFYVITNEVAFTNAVFILFNTNCAELSGVATNEMAPPDVDLYVSADPSLLEFNPAAFDAASKSFGPGPDEVVIEPNAMPSAYFIAVKSESAAAGGFGLAALFSDLPFFETDTNGVTSLRAIPVPVVPGDGSPSTQSLTLAFAVPQSPITFRRVIVNTTVSQTGDGSLRADMRHSDCDVTLRDFSGDGAFTNMVFSFDDTLEKDPAGCVPSIGPGTLEQFAGRAGAGPWIMRFIDAPGKSTVHGASVVMYPQQPAETGIEASVLPGACRDEFFNITPGATNVVMGESLLTGSGPVQVEFSPVAQTGNSYDGLALDTGSTNGVVQIDPWSNPPVAPGLWRARICNNGPDLAGFALVSSAATNVGKDASCRTRIGSAHAISDSTTSTFALVVTNPGTIHSVEAGVRLDHPRLSDLALWLTSPHGTRVLLDSHRGGVSTNGMGHGIIVTNVFPVSSSGGPQVSTNRIDLRRTSGTITVNYSFWAIADSMRIYYETNLIYDSGLISGSGETNITYGPGEESFLKIVMNEGDNPDPDTFWFYTVTSVVPDYAFMTFSDGALAVKFAPEPFDAAPDGNYLSFAYGPEEPLAQFQGEAAAGVWTLEVQDAVAGPGGPAALLQEFELSLVLRNENPLPILVESGQPLGDSLAPGQVQWVRINVPPWTAVATNRLTASGRLTLVYGKEPGSWVASEAITNTVLLAGSLDDQVVMTAGGQPSLVPGSPYFLGVINTNDAPASYSLRVDLDPEVQTLWSGFPVSRNGLLTGQCDYYSFAISDRAQCAQFELLDLSGDMVLFLRKNLPLPGPDNAQALSDNPGTSPELITLRTDVGPVILSPGSWFICASNSSPAEVSYTAAVHSWPSTGLPLLISGCEVQGSEISITWRSLPGAVYHLESSADLQQPWFPASPAITASGETATYRVPITEPFAFFRVAEGLP